MTRKLLALHDSLAPLEPAAIDIGETTWGNAVLVPQEDLPLEGGPWSLATFVQTGAGIHCAGHRGGASPLGPGHGARAYCGLGSLPHASQEPQVRTVHGARTTEYCGCRLEASCGRSGALAPQSWEEYLSGRVS